MATLEAHRRTVIVELPAEIDLLSQDGAYDQLYAAVACGAAVVIADFTATTFCDSASLHRLMAIRRRAAARGVELRLAVPPGGTVRCLVQLMHLDHLLPVYSSPREAAAGTIPRLDPAGLPRRTVGRPAAMADIIDLIRASGLHILHWQLRLGELRRRRGELAPGPQLAAAWDTVASLIDLHMAAWDEVCGPAIYSPTPPGRALAREVMAAHEDIREIMRETSLQSPGWPQWWRLATKALSAWARQLDQEEHGPLDDCLRRADAVLRDQLAHQWRAFREACIRDSYPDAPPQLPTCQLRLGRPAPPRLADPAFCPLACTCQACDQGLTRVPLSA